MLINTRPDQFGYRYVLLLSVLLLLSNIFSMYSTAAPSATATASIGITKLAGLQVDNLDPGELYRNGVRDNLTTTLCVQVQGDPIPYRVRASGLGGLPTFSIENSRSGERIPYTVYWSDNQGLQRFETRDDVSRVNSGNTVGNCHKQTLSVKFDDGAYTAAKRGYYTDTLSILFVIE